MGTINDEVLRALGEQGFTGDGDDRLRQWAVANGATSRNLNDALLQVWKFQSNDDGDINDALFKGLVILGFGDGALNDNMRTFWVTGGLLEPPPPAPTWLTTPTPPPGTRNQGYVYDLTPHLEIQVGIITVTVGQLPTGLSIVGRLISGIPSVAVNFPDIQLTTTNRSGFQECSPFSINIAAEAAAEPGITGTNSEGSSVGQILFEYVPEQVITGFIPHTPSYVPRITGWAGFAAESPFGTCRLGDTSVDVRIQRVTNLDDGTGAGTEREALSTSKGSADGMVVVYDIAGWRDASSGAGSEGVLSCSTPRITVARNTAPGKGFFSRGGKFRFTGSDQLAWHVGSSWYPRLSTDADGNIADSLESGQGDNIAFVNCAAWFGGDETFSLANCDRVSIYNCITAHGLSRDSIGRHNFNSLYEHAAPVDVSRSAFYHSKLRSPRQSSDRVRDNSTLNHFNMSNSISYNGQEYLHMLGDNDDGILSENCYDNVGVAGVRADGRAFCIVSNTGQQSSEWNSNSQVYVNDNKLIGIGSEYQNDVERYTGASPVNRQGTIILASVPSGYNGTPIVSFTNLEAIDLIQNNLGPRPGDSLGYFDMLKTQCRNAEIGIGDLGDWCNATGESVYPGDSTPGFDDIPSASKDNFAEIAAFLSANYTEGVEFTLIDSGANHVTYRFTVDAGLCPLDVWLNDEINNSVMNAGWEV